MREKYYLEGYEVSATSLTQARFAVEQLKKNGVKPSIRRVISSQQDRFKTFRRALRWPEFIYPHHGAYNNDKEV
jgi:hypothetical protein